MECMANSITYAALSVASAAAVVWASQFVPSHILPAFETVTTILNGIG